MIHALILFGFLFTFSRTSLAMDASLGEVINVQVEGSPVLWTGDGFSLSCPRSSSCVVNTAQLGVGTFRIIFSRTLSGKMEFGEINLTVKAHELFDLANPSSVSIRKKTSEVSTGFKGYFDGKNPFAAAITKFAFLERQMKTRTVKDFPEDLQSGDKISSLADSVIYSQIELGQSSILLGQAAIEVQAVPGSSGSLYYTWLNGTVLFHLKKGKLLKIAEYELSLDPSVDQTPTEDPLVLVSPYRQGFVVVPIKGKYRIASTKRSHSGLSPSFALLIEGQTKSFLSLTSCDDAVSYIREKIDFGESCSPLSFEADLSFSPKLLESAGYNTDSPHLETIYQEWLENFFQIPLTVDQRFDFQISGNDIPPNRFDLKLRYLLQNNKCADISESNPSSPTEISLLSYYEGICKLRQGEIGLAANRWSWVLQKQGIDEAQQSSNFSLMQLSKEPRKKGNYAIFAGLDNNATRKGSNADRSPFNKFAAKKFYVLGGFIKREDVLSTESSLKLFFESDLETSFYMAESILGMSEYRAQFALPVRFTTHRGEELQFKPKVIAKAIAAPLDSLGLGSEITYKKKMLSAKLGFATYEDFNNNLELFDAISGNPISLNEASDRPYKEFFLALGYHPKFGKVDLDFNLTKYSAKYRFNITDNQSFDAWKIESIAKYILIPLLHLEGGLELEARSYKGGFSGSKISAQVASVWDFHPDYSVYAKLEHHSANSALTMGKWSKNIYLMGIKRDFR